MNRKRNIVIAITAALCSIALVYGVYVLQVRQIALQQTVRVLVPKDFIRAGSVITEDLLEFKPIFSASYTPSMIKEPARIVGQETVVPLGRGEPVLAWKLNRFHLLPHPNEATFQVPKEYILSVSNGIRAGDRVVLYASSADGGSKRLFNTDITVASVKTSGNVEIDNPKSPNLLSKAEGDEVKMYLSRMEANGSIDQVNLNLTEEQWMTIDRLCSTKKTKLVIAFTASSITSE
ncbi:flagellar basal body P-ring biosynthesis protein FlgA [Gordoniibacillus kamchatkensis]|uniref:Flagellar basal body P-ring biosynthesis protein FlgA n=1 Tax=Gordoniibacillus kamchatkensis TaxID=1590651 RepID=A0ABR5ACW7_9BACL|nr:flagellar basal body P-ring biosynthesis protein FlgA [Paenibacillus sp. VKM B-2647]KIL38869.1 flagellar basal body P-ring biosynthesis protein FlgA [Paenibacillus sp. VKM B-2647]